MRDAPNAFELLTLLKQGALNPPTSVDPREFTLRPIRSTDVFLSTLRQYAREWPENTLKSS
jgi:hypothetical protein